MDNLVILHTGLLRLLGLPRDQLM
jgi:hypothetical protein